MSLTTTYEQGREWTVQQARIKEYRNARRRAAVHKTAERIWAMVHAGRPQHEIEAKLRRLARLTRKES